jgi:hypothetical protein
MPHFPSRRIFRPGMFPQIVVFGAAGHRAWRSLLWAASPTRSQMPAVEVAGEFLTGGQA